MERNGSIHLVSLFGAISPGNGPAALPIVIDTQYRSQERAAVISVLQKWEGFYGGALLEGEGLLQLS